MNRFPRFKLYLYYLTALYFALVTLNYLWLLISFPGYIKNGSTEVYQQWLDSPTIYRTRVENLCAYFAIQIVTVCVQVKGTYLIYKATDLLWLNWIKRSLLIYTLLLLAQATVQVYYSIDKLRHWNSVPESFDKALLILQFAIQLFLGILVWIERAQISKGRCSVLLRVQPLTHEQLVRVQAGI